MLGYQILGCFCLFLPIWWVENWVFHCCFSFYFLEYRQSLELTESIISGQWYYLVKKREGKKSPSHGKYSLSLQIILYLLPPHLSTSCNKLPYSVPMPHHPKTSTQTSIHSHGSDLGTGLWSRHRSTRHSFSTSERDLKTVY